MMKSGSTDVKKIMLNALPDYADRYKFNFSEWEFNESAGHDVCIEHNKITIRKFKPNTWIIHGPAVAGNSNSAICAYCAGTSVKVHGVTSARFPTEVNMTNNHGAGSDIPHFRGMVFLPASIEGSNMYFMPERCYTWEGCWSAADKRDLPAPADYPAFRGNVGGHGRYGYCLQDATQVIFPANLYDFNSWNRNQGLGSTWYYALGLYTADTSNVGEDGLIDFSDDPITIELTPLYLLDPASIEAWEIRDKDGTIYQKDKTVENCWREYYEIADRTEEFDDGTTLRWSVLKIPDNSKFSLVPNWHEQVNVAMWSWNIRPNNTDVWEDIKDYYANKPILGMTPKRLFDGCNIGGDLRLLIHRVPGCEEFSIEDFIADTDVTSVLISCMNSGSIGSWHNAFRRASKLKGVVVTNVYAYPAKDVSGMFEFCAAMKSYREYLINWGLRAVEGLSASDGTGHTNIGYFVEYSGITEIPLHSTENRYSNDNTIIAGFIEQAFNTSSLLRIKPVMDLRYINPTNQVYNAFNCPNLTEARIKNLNHGTWRFDGSTGTGYTGNIPKLDKESIEYLFATLSDLTFHDPEYVSEFDYDSRPAVSSADLYCPATWGENITAEMISAAKAKGWTIYVGGIKQDAVSYGGVMMEPDDNFLRYHWCGEDAPVNGQWVDRVSGALLSLNGAVHQDNSYLCDVGGYMQMSGTMNFGTHFIIRFDADVEPVLNGQDHTFCVLMDVNSIKESDNGVACGLSWYYQSPGMGYKMFGNSNSSLYVFPNGSFPHAVGEKLSGIFEYQNAPYNDNFDILCFRLNDGKEVLSTNVHTKIVHDGFDGQKILLNRANAGNSFETTNYTNKITYRDIKIYVYD